MGRVCQTTLTIVLSAMALNACDGRIQPIGAPSVAPQMLPAAKHQDLLYVSDGRHNVMSFSFPNGKFVGTLTGLEFPGPECSDQSGNVYIVDGAGIVEYAHGGVNPIDTLHLQSETAALDCSIRPNGDVAVATQNEVCCGPSFVDVFQKHGRGSPQEYQDQDIIHYRACAYDGAGDLFVAGTNASSKVVVAELREGASTFQTITMKHHLTSPLIRWDGTYLAVYEPPSRQSQHQASVLRIRISGTVGSVAGEAQLSGPRFAYGQIAISGNIIAVPIGLTKHAEIQRRTPSSSFRAIGFWLYPAGGKAFKILPSSGFRPKISIRGDAVSVP